MASQNNSPERWTQNWKKVLCPIFEGKHVQLGENCCQWDGRDRLIEKAIMLLLRCHYISLLHNLSLANLSDKRWSGVLRGAGYAAGTHFLVGIPATCNYSVRYGVPLLPRSGLYKTYRSLAGVFEHYTPGWPEQGYGSHLSLCIYVYKLDEIEGL